MSLQQFENDCPGCRPVIIDLATGKPDAKAMQVIDFVWKQTTLAERTAFHRFTCLNARDPEALAVVRAITAKFQAAFEAADN